MMDEELERIYIDPEAWAFHGQGATIYRDEEGQRYYHDVDGARWYPTATNGTPLRTRIAGEVKFNDEKPDPVVEFRAGVLRSKLLTGEELDKLPPPEPLIEGLLMKNSLAILYGHPGSGKSFVAVDWSLCIATGRGWQGRAVHQGKVLFIAAEGGTGLGQRKRAWSEDRGEDDVSNVTWLPMAVSLLDAKWSEALVMLVAEGNYSLVVIDTLSRSMSGGDENSPRDMTAAVDNADRVRRASGACVLVVHHKPRTGDNMRGHTSLEGAADTAVDVRSDEVTIKLSVSKQKDTASGDTVLLRLEPIGDSCVLRAHDGLGSNAEAEEKLLDTIGSVCGSEGMSATSLLKVAEMSERGFYRTLKALRDGGFVTNVGTETRPRWTVTKRGEQ